MILRRSAYSSCTLLLSRRAFSASSMPNQPPQMESEVDENGLRKRPFGSSKPSEDAFGHTDAFAAVRESIQASQQSRSETEKEASSEVDHVASSVNRRRNKQKKTMDHILGDVLNDALRMRDAGQKPDMDFIYKQTQERVYEAEHGRKPPSQKDQNANYIPFPPDFHLYRLQPFTIFDEDPWPERSITPENPVLSVAEMERDKAFNGGKIQKGQAKMFEPRDGYDVISEFSDSVDELTHWECKFLEFVRDVPLWQRRTLPLLHEHYRAITHRLIRAEKRFITVRNAAMGKAKTSPEAYKATEDRVERVRSFYAETHKSLSSPNYDPAQMKKRSLLGTLMKMTKNEFASWKLEQSQMANQLIAQFNADE